MYDIIILGGGLSGLTIAHELIKKKFKILIIEKDDELWGMARSDTKRSLYPSENCWRAYAPFYKNAFQIMKEIPYYNTNVLNNLTLPFKFYFLYDKYGYKSSLNLYNSSLTVKDKLIVHYLGIIYLLSNNRRDDYYSYNLEQFFKKYLSNDGYDYMINFMAGAGYGMNKNEVSMGHFYHFPVLTYMQKDQYTHKDSLNGNNLGLWHVMNGPTSDVWIKPWISHLKENGVDILTNTELVKINYNNNNITSVEIKQNGMIKQLKSKEYILSLNPFNTVDILKNSNMIGLYNNFKLLTDKTKCKQISFRIGINKDIKYPIDHISFVMIDSEFNISWIPQEKFWKQKPSIKSLWSGAIVDFENKGKLFNTSAENLDNEKFKKEIIYQILRSNSFRKLIYDYNGFYINNEDIEYFEIWYEWNYINGKQELINKKWVNNMYNEKYRPLQKTNYDNLFLSGAHTKNTTLIWSMEGAIESGKITSNHILDKYNMPNIEHYKHLDPLYIRIIQYIDNILYKLYLPNIFNLLIIIIIIILIFILYKYIINAKNIKKLLRMTKIRKSNT